jgi:tripeptidyl-peptidase-1
MSVKYGSNQSVAEFYGEVRAVLSVTILVDVASSRWCCALRTQFYSNSDLVKFLQLSGLPNATIPVQNVYGDLPDDQSNPGGEAQLDVEYIMVRRRAPCFCSMLVLTSLQHAVCLQALAPNASTFFYSFSDLNPYDTNNEGFLAYLTYVSNQAYPPLVHSLSYGDQESTVFNTSNPGSVDYGQRCDQEFMKMGLRGMSLLFSSGDDGIAGKHFLFPNSPDKCLIFKTLCLTV